MHKCGWTVLNDNGTQRLDVRASEYGDGIKKVALIQIADSMMFAFTMNPDQARHMAEALIAATEALE